MAVGTIADVQERWIKGEIRDSDMAFMLNEVHRLSDEVETYEVEQASMLESFKRLAAQREEMKRDLEAERHNHKVTLDLLEKAIAELVSWREAAKGRAS